MKIVSVKFSAIFSLWVFASLASAEPETCTYSTYKWNVNEQRAVDYHEVTKLYSEVIDTERDELSGCTVCLEDQQWITVADLAPIRLCKKYAQRVENELDRLSKNGESIFKLVGYRVGMTRGNVDELGNRTQFSNHSFGIAIDVNDEQNGLYDQCLVYSDQCRLRKGGRWSPSQPGSLTEDSRIVSTMKMLGFKWGGEIAGKQKDFMHFSPSGY